MPPAAPNPPATESARLRGWRLAALVLLVLMAHGLLLSAWLSGRADTPGSASGPVAEPAGSPPASVRVTQATADTPPPPAATVAPASPGTPKNQTAGATATAAAASAQAQAQAQAQAKNGNTQQKQPSEQYPKASVAIKSDSTTTQPGSPAARAQPTDQPARAATAPRPPAPAPATPLAPTGLPATGAAGTEANGPTVDGLMVSLPGKLQVPASTTLNFDVRATRKGVSLPATSTLRFTQDGHAYDARMDIKALFVGTRTQTSKGLLDPTGGLQPLRFGDKNKSEQAAHFDRTRQPPVLRFSANTPDAPLHAHSQDRLSVLFQLAAMLGGEPERWATGSTVVVHTAGPRDADMWQFKVGATEQLSLPAGNLTAVHLVRTPMHAYDNQVEIWLAPSLGHLPVRVLWTQANGDSVDQRLSSHEP